MDFKLIIIVDTGSLVINVRCWEGGKLALEYIFIIFCISKTSNIKMYFKKWLEGEACQSTIVQHFVKSKNKSYHQS